MVREGGVWAGIPYGSKLGEKIPPEGGGAI